MANILKILSEKSIPSNSTTFLLASFNGESIRFKIVAENYNCNWGVDVYIQTKNYDFAKIASKNDIPGVNYVSYVSNDKTRIDGNENNIKAAIKFIETVF